MSQRCIQFVAFTIREDQLGAFLKIKAQVAAEAHDLPGLISSTTQQSRTSPQSFVDTMVWESAEACAAGQAAFEKLPTTPAFLGMMAGPPTVADVFDWVAGDTEMALVGPA